MESVKNGGARFPGMSVLGDQPIGDGIAAGAERKMESVCLNERG